MLETPFRPKVDLLLVVDNSGSMVAKQTALVATFRELLGQLSYEGADFDYHIGVVSTDVGSWVADGQPWTVSLGACDSFASDDGKLQALSCLDRQNGSAEAARTCTQLCPDRRFLPQDGAPFLRRHNGISNVPVAMELDAQTGLMVDRGPEYALSCMALLGDGGCALTSPLEAMKRALDGHLPGNSEFLRPDSNLQILFLTDKDDCSVQASRRAENDPRTRDCAVPDLEAGYDCYNPSFRCLAHDLSCDQPLNSAGIKSGCFERPDSYLQPVGDYARFLRQLPQSPSLSIVGLWTLPALDEESGRWVVAQSPQVAGSAGLMAATDALAACSVAGSAAWTGQPQQRLSGFAAASFDNTVGDVEVSICQPQTFSQTIEQVENWGAMSSVMECLWDGAPKLSPDGHPDCVASEVTWSQNEVADGQAITQCAPACCAAMPSKTNLDWGWSWDYDTIVACASEPVNCFCVTPTTYCLDGAGYAAGVWLAGNADLTRYMGVQLRCAAQDPLD